MESQHEVNLIVKSFEVLKNKHLLTVYFFQITVILRVKSKNYRLAVYINKTIKYT